LRDATTETETRVEFPAKSPWTLDQLLDPDFVSD
jgi:hypothetical protein